MCKHKTILFKNYGEMKFVVKLVSFINNEYCIDFYFPVYKKNNTINNTEKMAKLLQGIFIIHRGLDILKALFLNSLIKMVENLVPCPCHSIKKKKKFNGHVIRSGLALIN